MSYWPIAFGLLAACGAALSGAYASATGATLAMLVLFVLVKLENR